MKKVIFIIAAFAYSCGSTKTTKISELELLKKENDSLKLVIIELQEEVNILRDELRFKESEVSYWGHKYDSLLNK